MVKDVVVIKIGSSSVLLPNSEINLILLRKLVRTCLALKRAGFSVVLVSSGAVAVSLSSFSEVERTKLLKRKPFGLSLRQALASIGQVKLMHTYSEIFAEEGALCSQVLLTYDSFQNKEQYANAEHTFSELLQLGIVPVVNENDTVSTEELRSENDSMAALLSGLLKAKYLFLLTDVDGVYLDNPITNANAKKIDSVVLDNTTVSKPSDTLQLAIEDVFLSTGVEKVATSGQFGTGGIFVKINAAHLASCLGIEANILLAENCDKILSYIQSLEETGSSNGVGTRFVKAREAPSSHKRWIKSLRTRGAIILDKGAASAAKNRKNLYSVGISAIEGAFPQLAPVTVKDSDGNILGVGLVNYSSTLLESMKRLKSSEIVKKHLAGSGVAIHRKNLVMNYPKPGVEGERDYSNEEYDSLS